MTKEGFLFPLPFLIFGAISFYLFIRFLIFSLGYISALFFLLALLVMLFFRDPARKIPAGDKLILSPADGRIIKSERNGTRPSLSIFLSIFNVHVTRSPVAGLVKSVEFHKGRFLKAYKDSAQRENQRNEIEIETGSGPVRLHQVTGAIARRTIFKPKPGQTLVAGEKVGLIRFGSRVDLMLPPGSTIDVSEGQKVVGGITILGRLP